jgi:signal transduction histidine kinase
VESIGTGCIAISVHNEGEPIPAGVRARMTQPFFSTKPNGTGLGLAIVRRLVEQHGGELEVCPETAPGATLRLTFPRIAGTHPGPERA